MPTRSPATRPPGRPRLCDARHVSVRAACIRSVRLTNGADSGPATSNVDIMARTSGSRGGAFLSADQLAHQREEWREQVSHEGSEEEYSANVGRAWADPLQELHCGIMHAGVTDGGGT
jgi:hypothetical protein